MKIAFLNVYAGNVERGAETFTQELAKRLSKEHEIVWYKGFSKIRPQHQFQGSMLNQLKKRLFLDKPNREVLRFTLKNIMDIKKNKFGVIIPTNGFWQVLLLKSLKPFGKFKILITGHSGPGWDERFNLYLQPDIFIATTKPASKWARKTSPWTKTTLIPYGIDVKSYRTAESARIKLTKPVILCPSALVSYKRVHLAIKAVSQLNKTSLLVLGKGDLKSKLEQEGKKLLGNRFKITYVKHSEIPKFYKACDIITLPSSPQENSPMVFLESLASGKTVITTDSPRNRWMLGEAAYYCDPINTKQYAQTMKKALDEVIHDQKKEQIDAALNKFKWENVLNEYNSILKQL